MSDASKRPIIVIKKKISGGGHHGGAWKVAYADFVTAMMSLFIVLWLLNSTPQVKKAVAGYFNDPAGSGKETGAASIGSEAADAVSIDTKNVQKLKEEIQKAILQQKDLGALAKQVEVTVTGEGLRIELIEGNGGTFFESGSGKLNANGVKLMAMLADQVKVLPNHLMIEGHTDAKPFSSTNGYTNWELSADRANAARKVLQDSGVRTDQISQVRGYADQKLRIPKDPDDPSNRRISVIVQWVNPDAPSAGPALNLAKLAPEAKATGDQKSEAAHTAEPKAETPTAPKPETPTTPAAAPAPTPAAAKAPAAKPSMVDRLKAMVPSKGKK
jgi:chemotaxis protein MotB